MTSPSSRRAWIEIHLGELYLAGVVVALLAEGVDRNLFDNVVEESRACRPPRGGRG